MSFMQFRLISTSILLIYGRHFTTSFQNVKKLAMSFDITPQKPLYRTISSLSKIAKIAIPSIIAAQSMRVHAATVSNINGEVKRTVGALGNDAYTTLGCDMPMCRILNGMWQVSGAHGFSPERRNVVSKMTECAEDGFTSFDLADIYGPAEDYVGSFTKGLLAKPTLAQDSCQFFTKWVPRPTELEKYPQKTVTAAIDQSLARMERDSLDLLQFHWWDYSNQYYFQAMDGLLHLQQQGKIKHLGLTNFDTKHMLTLVENDVPLVSNQVSYSILDDRPKHLMVEACKEHNIQLLCYGTLLGGFLSDYWLGKTDPSASDKNNSARRELANVSLRKYLPWINIWGGWELFQELLATLQRIGQKYDGVSISNVAVRWVLDQPQVGGAIVGVRFGLKDHLQDNRRIFSFQLDEDDRERIAAIQKKARFQGNALYRIFGDCGGEYRRR